MRVRLSHPLEARLQLTQPECPFPSMGNLLVANHIRCTATTGDSIQLPIARSYYGSNNYSNPSNTIPPILGRGYRHFASQEPPRPQVRVSRLAELQQALNAFCGMLMLLHAKLSKLIRIPDPSGIFVYCPAITSILPNLSIKTVLAKSFFKTSGLKKRIPAVGPNRDHLLSDEL